MNPNEECDKCFEDVTKKIDQVVNVAKNAIVNMNHAHVKSLEERERHSAEFYAAQEQKHKEFLELQEKRGSRRDGFLALLLTCFAAVIGYQYIQQREYEKKVVQMETLKANKNEVLRIDDAKTINDFTNNYSESRYELKKGAIPDPTNYKLLIETLFERASRGSKIKND